MVRLVLLALLLLWMMHWTERVSSPIVTVVVDILVTGVHIVKQMLPLTQAHTLRLYFCYRSGYLVS